MNAVKRGVFCLNGWLLMANVKLPFGTINIPSRDTWIRPPEPEIVITNHVSL